MNQLTKLNHPMSRDGHVYLSHIYIYKFGFILSFVMKVIILITLLVAVAQALPNSYSINTELNEEWEIYKTKHGKVYHIIEEYTRRLIWEQTIKYIQEHNIRYDLGEHSYFLGINQFSDLTHEEFLAKYIRYDKQTKQNNSIEYMAPLNVGALPNTVDWRSGGLVTPVKNQLHCHSSWAFSATGALECQYSLRNNKLVSFSEQQLIDCSADYAIDGCIRGDRLFIYSYIIEKGIEQESDYPYTGTFDSCRYNASKVVTKMYTVRGLPQNDEETLQYAVWLVGPISVEIDASNPSFQSYSGGVYDEPHCSSKRLNHDMLIIGYGTDNGQAYWLVKNSFGTSWGLDGYIKMSRNKNNQCGIATNAIYPIM